MIDHRPTVTRRNKDRCQPFVVREQGQGIDRVHNRLQDRSEAFRKRMEEVGREICLPCPESAPEPSGAHVRPYLVPTGTSTPQTLLTSSQ